MTPAETKYYFDYIDQRFRRAAELTRTQTWFLVNIQLEKKSRVSTPKKLWRFPWEDDGPDLNDFQEYYLQNIDWDLLDKIYTKHGRQTAINSNGSNELDHQRRGDQAAE